MLRVLLLIAIVLGAWRYFLGEDSVELGAGVSAADAPRQTRLAGAESFDLNGYRITPLAGFSIRAKVLAREDYRFGREADLAPLDLALGWGRMSDEAVLAQITISQSGRWYRWHTRSFPIPRREIETHSANMHLIPADERVADTLQDIRSGQVVKLEGLLVRAVGDDGWRWQSSLTRNDTGSRSCELVYVERARIVNG